MQILETFTAAYLQAIPGAADPAATVPQRLCAALAVALPADAVALSLFANRKAALPTVIGASSPEAERATRIEFTCGEGPSITAHDDATTVTASTAALHNMWPMYSELAWASTFRSVVAFPLPGALALTATVTLLFRAADPPAMPMADLTALGQRCTDTLLDTTLDQEVGPPWLYTPILNRHQRITIAAGIISAQRGLKVDNALALLRARAWATRHTADQVAEDVITHAESQQFTWW